MRYCDLLVMRCDLEGKNTTTGGNPFSKFAFATRPANSHAQWKRVVVQCDRLIELWLTLVRRTSWETESTDQRPTTENIVTDIVVATPVVARHERLIPNATLSWSSPGLLAGGSVPSYCIPCVHLIARSVQCRSFF